MVRAPPAGGRRGISCRLVPNQDPRRILELVRAHIQRQTPPGVRVTIRPEEAVAWPYRVPAGHPANEAARAVLVELYGREPYQIRMGGSVPVCETFLRHLGAHSVTFGFSLNDGRFHAPDEFFRLASFRRGQVAYGKLLERLV